MGVQPTEMGARGGGCPNWLPEIGRPRKANSTEGRGAALLPAPLVPAICLSGGRLIPPPPELGLGVRLHRAPGCVPHVRVAQWALMARRTEPTSTHDTACAAHTRCVHGKWQVSVPRALAAALRIQVRGAHT